MKYLKRFESRTKIVSEKEIRDICEGVFVELLDKGFNINIQPKGNTLARPNYTVSLNKYNLQIRQHGIVYPIPNPFSWDDVKDKVLFLIELLSTEFLILKSIGSEIEIRDVRGNFYNFTIKDLIEESESGNYKEHNGRTLDTLDIAKISILNVT